MKHMISYQIHGINTTIWIFIKTYLNTIEKVYRRLREYTLRFFIRASLRIHVEYFFTLHFHSYFDSIKLSVFPSLTV